MNGNNEDEGKEEEEEEKKKKKDTINVVDKGPLTAVSNSGTGIKVFS